MSGFDENPFGEPTIDNPFAVSKNLQMSALIACVLLYLFFTYAFFCGLYIAHSKPLNQFSFLYLIQSNSCFV